ncbi:ATP-binding cassette domain-containing protein [Ilumatobacter sp.]|uniref:ATP-binding cassette domain-containing protein n=1 Tax=Ilumatobacter sp. TaxID=1967498 RepID=UPI003AF731C0
MVGPFELREVTAGPIDAPVLRSVSVELPCRGITALAGPSGAGKSTLLRLLNRLDDPVAGDVRWDGTDLASWDPVELRRRVGMVFQRPPVFEGTVLDNLRVASSGLAPEAAATALVRVGLETELSGRTAADLSGGEAQRMCFARAMLTEPAVLLADEPTSSLDGASRRTLESLAADLAAGGMPMLWVSHDVEQLRRLADHVVVLVDGGVAASGSLDELDRHDDPLVRELVGAP